jgi:hypothetical protein
LSRAPWRAAIAVVLCCIGSAASAQSNAPAGASGRAVRVCPATAQAIREPTDCVCTAAAVETEAPLWGVDIYSDDSSICRAARHAGVVTPGGGTVRVTPLGPQQSFAGAERHGITSQRYGQFPRAFSVAASEARSSVDLDQCPTNFQAYRTRGGALSCICAGEQTTAGTVWGTDVYTDDSAICRAAVHAGAIPATGGPVRLHTVRGRQSYAGSARNGVRTEGFGAWQGAFAFDR